MKMEEKFHESCNISRASAPGSAREPFKAKAYDRGSVKSPSLWHIMKYYLNTAIMIL